MRTRYRLPCVDPMDSGPIEKDVSLDQALRLVDDIRNASPALGMHQWSKSKEYGWISFLKQDAALHLYFEEVNEKVEYEYVNPIEGSLSGISTVDSAKEALLRYFESICLIEFLTAVSIAISKEEG